MQAWFKYIWLLIIVLRQIKLQVFTPVRKERLLVLLNKYFSFATTILGTWSAVSSKGILISYLHHKKCNSLMKTCSKKWESKRTSKSLEMPKIVSICAII